MDSEATLQAFYMRVMQRVCRSYRDSSNCSSDADIERLQQKWQEKLKCYTGKHTYSIAARQETSKTLQTMDFANSGIEAFGDEDESLVASSSTSSTLSVESDKASKQVVGRPNTQLEPQAVTSMTSSIFSKMLGSKRKLHQLDGSVSDDDGAVEWQDSADLKLKKSSQAKPTKHEAYVEQKDLNGSDSDDDFFQENDEKIEEQEKEELVSNYAESAPSLLVSEIDFLPVSGLSGINLPLQVAAEYSKFVHRGKRRGYFGRLHAIVLTWPRFLKAKESIQPGDMVWWCSDTEQGFLGGGEVVKVIAMGEKNHELTIGHSNGQEARVQLRQVRRLKEYLIRRGTVRLRSEHER